MNRVSALLLALAALAPAQWDPVAPLPEARYSGALIALGGKLYYVGGSSAGGLKTRTLFIYDIATDSWTVGESLATARHRFGAVECRGRIYVFGGWGNGGQLLKSGEVYDTATGRWSAIETLPTGRASVFCGARQDPPGRVYCIGGWTGTQALNQTLEYNVATSHWTARAPMPSARCEGASGTSGGYVLCIGGTPDASTLLATNELYDPEQDTWFVARPMPTPRMACAGAAWNEVAVTGGIVSPGCPSRRHEYYDWGHDYWRTGESLPEPMRYHAATFAFVWPNEFLYVAGGTDSTGAPSRRVWRTHFPVALSDRPRSHLPHPSHTTITDGLLRLGLPASARSLRPALLNPMGRRVLELTAGLNDLGRLPAGVYYVCLPDGSAPRRVVLTR